MDAAYALKYAGMDGQAAVTELLAALKDDDPFVRRYVAAAIGETGFGPERAIPALIAALDDPDADVRSQAAVALGKVGAGSITDLIGLLKGDKREYAVVALADIGVPAVRAVTVGLSDRAWGSEASLILRFMGEPAITELMRMARTTDGSLRRAAVRGLKAIGLPAISKIAEALDLTDPELRRLFAVTIVAIAFNDSDKRLNGVDDPLRTRLRPLIIDALRDRGTDASDRTLIARALAAFPGEAERMVSALMEALGDPSAEVRRAAIVSLGTFKENSAATVKALMRVLARDSDPNVREGAVRALATFGKEAAPAVPLLIAVIRKRSPGASLSWSAARALGAIGADADGAIPVLSDMLADRREAASLRVAGAEALGSMGRKAVPTLIRALALRDEEEYRAVLDALRFAGKDAAPALPRLFEALRSKDYSIGSAAEYVLESIGKPAVPGLLLALEASDEEVRERTAYALGTIGPDAKEAFPALVKIVQDRSAPKRLGEYARRAIASIGSEAIPVLIAASRTDKNGVSLDDLAKALGVYNAKPEDAVRTLVERLRSPGLTEYDKEANVRGLVWCRAGSPEAAQELVKILEAADSPETLREAAVDALIRQGKEASVAGGVLQRILSDPASSATMRERTARALGAMRAASAVPILTALVEDRSAAVGVRQAASWALGRVGEAAGSAALALAEVMRDRTADQDLRGEANDALEGLGQHAAAATSILLETLEDSAQDLSARFGAMRVLDKIGTVPIQTAPALVRLGLMPDDNVDQAMQIVRRMGPEAAPAAVPLLVEGLPMSSPEGVGRILHTLSGLGPRGITALIDATASADAGIRLQALVELSPAASMNPEVFNVLMRALRDADRAVRLQAANTLVALGGQLKEMGPILTTIFNDDYIHRHVPGFAEYERKNVVRKGAKAPPPAPPVRTIEELPVAFGER